MHIFAINLPTKLSMSIFLYFIYEPIFPKANYGQLIMHADRKIPTWTRLAQTALAGSNRLILIAQVNNWRPGDRIVVATTSKDNLQSEVHIIRDISLDRRTITLNEQLQYNHLGEQS